MKVIRAGVFGFCKGVRRAVDIAWQASEESLDNCSRRDAKAQRVTSVYTIGPLIHNHRILKNLEERGVICLDEAENFAALRLCVSSLPKNSTVIIRAHGVAPQIEAELRQQGLQILDATCSHVKLSQHKTCDFAQKGYRIFLAGEKNHAEIAGIQGYALAGKPANAAFVVGTPAEAENRAAELQKQYPSAKTVLIGQTTISEKEYTDIADVIKKYFPTLEVLNTICGATADRQNALRELCRKVDAVIIAGSPESSNTRRLLSLAHELGKPAWLVESSGELPPEIAGYRTAGLSAGASAPDDLIDEIEAALKA